jgi:hypothetical protein
MAVQSQEPGPVKRVPEWVGDGDMLLDVSSHSDRHISVMALDKTLRLTLAVARLTDRLEAFLTADTESKIILMRELPAQSKRISVLEAERTRMHTVPLAVAPEDGLMRPEESSYHNLHDMMVEAGDILYKRMKDPRDQMNSDRVRDIAAAVLDNAKVAEDAATFRKLKKGGKHIALEVAKHALKWILPLLVGGGAVHWGVHRGQMPHEEKPALSSPANK